MRRHHPAIVSTCARSRRTPRRASRSRSALTPACVWVSTSARPDAVASTARTINSVFPQPAGATTEPRSARASSSARRSAVVIGASRPAVISSATISPRRSPNSMFLNHFASFAVAATAARSSGPDFPATSQVENDAGSRGRTSRRAEIVSRALSRPLSSNARSRVRCTPFMERSARTRSSVEFSPSHAMMVTFAFPAARDSSPVSALSLSRNSSVLYPSFPSSVATRGAHEPPPSTSATP
jgi:hypothetical protein